MDKDLFNKMLNDRAVRRAITFESHKLFFLFYFAHYVKYSLGKFHEEIIDITQNEENKLACMVAFRGSGKSTLITTSYTLWSILGRQSKRFALIICQTKAQAKQHMMNLRSELENNKLLQSDLGPFQEETDLEWGSSSLVFSNTNARITIASLDQSIRGIRHLEHRPDLIILDDIEDVQSVKTQDSRDKTFDWFTREIIPLGDLNTRIMIVGNLLHEDSLVMRLKDKIEEGDIEGVYKQYPLIDENGVCLWPGKFPDPESLEKFKKSIISEISWQREYLLLIVADEDQVVHWDWINYYDELPKNRDSYRQIIIGVDPAISETAKADSSAIVCGLIVSEDLDYKMYILPNIINEKMPFPVLIERIICLYKEMDKAICDALVVVESNGYQMAIVQQLEKYDILCEPVKTTTDKRSRLSLVSPRIKSSDILFPKIGIEKMLSQIVNFGNEKHDDLMDAFTICGHKYLFYSEPFVGFV